MWVACQASHAPTAPTEMTPAAANARRERWRPASRPSRPSAARGRARAGTTENHRAGRPGTGRSRGRRHRAGDGPGCCRRGQPHREDPEKQPSPRLRACPQGAEGGHGQEEPGYAHERRVHAQLVVRPVEHVVGGAAGGVGHEDPDRLTAGDGAVQRARLPGAQNVARRPQRGQEHGSSQGEAENQGGSHPANLLQESPCRRLRTESKTASPNR